MTSSVGYLSDDSTHSHDEINDIEYALTKAFGFTNVIDKVIVGVKDGKRWGIIQSYNKSPKGDIIFHQENGRIAKLSSYDKIWRFEFSKETAEYLNYSKTEQIQDQLVRNLEEQVALVHKLTNTENDQTCRETFECKKPNCRLNHPNGRRLDIVCRNKYECSKFKCGFLHPNGRRIDTECRNNYECTNERCGFSHPNGRKKNAREMADALGY